MILTQEDLDAISLSVRTNLSNELNLINQQYTMISEIYRLMGLQYDVPLVVRQDRRTAGNIYQTISINESTETTIVNRVRTKGVGFDVIGQSPIGV